MKFWLKSWSEKCNIKILFLYKKSILLTAGMNVWLGFVTYEDYILITIKYCKQPTDMHIYIYMYYAVTCYDIKY